MSRRAHIGFVAMLLCGAIYLLINPQLVSHAAPVGMKYRVFVPGVVKPTASSPMLTISEEQKAFDLINQQRRANGCGTLTYSTELAIAAENHSQDMANNAYVSHTGLNGSSFSQRAKDAGYAFFPSGEIIAAGQATAADVVNDWMQSDGHRAIILTCNNDDIGIGLVANPAVRYQYYWTAVFGQR